MSFLEAFDHEGIRTDEEEVGSKRVKREWIKKGYSHQMSLYGVLSIRALNIEAFSRIEVLSDTEYSDENVERIYEFFKAFKPIMPYTIWAYSGTRDAVKLVGRYQ